MTTKRKETKLIKQWRPMTFVVRREMKVEMWHLLFQLNFLGFHEIEILKRTKTISLLSLALNWCVVVVFRFDHRVLLKHTMKTIAFYDKSFDHRSIVGILFQRTVDERRIRITEREREREQGTERTVVTENRSSLHDVQISSMCNSNISRPGKLWTCLI